MSYQYENNSQKYSRGYAERDREYNNEYNRQEAYQPKSTGFADSLESQFYFDRPAVSQDRAVDYQNSYAENARTEKTVDYAYQTQNSANQEAYYADETSSYQDNGYANDYYQAAENRRAEELSKRYERTYEREERYKEEMDYTTDSAPSDTTMQFFTGRAQSASENPYEFSREKGEAVDKKYTVNTKGKILIAVYALVVVTVFALIILNTRLLKTMNATSESKRAEIAALSQEVTDLKQELDYVSSDEVIEEKAAEKGMVRN